MFRVARLRVEQLPSVQDPRPRRHNRPVSRQALKKPERILLQLGAEEDLDVVQEHHFGGSFIDDV